MNNFISQGTLIELKSLKYKLLKKIKGILDLRRYSYLCKKSREAFISQMKYQGLE